LAWIDPPESTIDAPPLTAPPQLVVAVPLLDSPGGSTSVNPTPDISDGFGLLIDIASVDTAPATTEPGVNDFLITGPTTAWVAVPDPERLAVCGLPAALLRTVRTPVRDPAAVGVNDTLIVQAPPATIDAPQPFETEKSPDAEISETASTPAPVFVSVTTCAADVEPTSLAPKVREDGDNETAAERAMPVPESETLCGLPEALLSTFSAPVLDPANAGLNVTLIEQVPPATSEAPQPFDCAKSPVAEMPAIASVPAPVLVSVTTCADDVVPTSRDANVRVEGESDTPGASPTPVPERLTACGLPDALLVTVIAPVLVPPALGLNVTLIEQERPAATDVPQSFDCAKSPEAAMPEMASDALPVLVSVKTCAAEVVPTSREAKFSAEGESPTPGAMATPVPASETLCGLPGASEATASVPERVPAAVGRKNTEILQLELAAIEEHSPERTKSPVVVMLVTVAAPAPELVMVTVCVAETVPTFTEPNESDAGETAMTGAVCWMMKRPSSRSEASTSPLPFAPSTCTVPVRSEEPEVGRVNWTTKVHEDCGGCTPTQVVELMEKLGSEPTASTMLSREEEEFPVLVTVTVR
jgi:hypothetical protein